MFGKSSHSSICTGTHPVTLTVGMHVVIQDLRWFCLCLCMIWACQRAINEGEGLILRN